MSPLYLLYREGQPPRSLAYIPYQNLEPYTTYILYMPLCVWVTTMGSVEKFGVLQSSVHEARAMQGAI